MHKTIKGNKTNQASEWMQMKCRKFHKNEDKGFSWPNNETDAEKLEACVPRNLWRPHARICGNRTEEKIRIKDQKEDRHYKTLNYRLAAPASALSLFPMITNVC